MLKNLKNGKSQDPYGLPNEIFKPDIAGSDLITALTSLMNRIKSEIIYQTSMEFYNVTNLYKNKGERSLYSSYRGIFRSPVLRNILDKLMHNDEYNTIDENLTDGNVGSRKHRNVRDNLFVINAVMNEAKQKPEVSLDLNVYDAFKCFDSMWLKECINDLYESGLKNDQLAVLYESMKSAPIAIQTSSGTTKSININEKVMQGTVWAGLMCTTTMDKLCKVFYEDPNLMYKFRGSVPVPPLEMVDDIATISKCGTTSVTTNSVVNTFMEQKKLKLNHEKCGKIHIGKKGSDINCPTNYAHKN